MDDPPKAQESAPSATEAAPTSAPEVDADSPAEVRVTFIALMLAAAVLCALPRQWGSAGILLGLALAGLVVHLRAGRQR
jgi:hypothetical protein